MRTRFLVTQPRVQRTLHAADGFPHPSASPRAFDRRTRARPRRWAHARLKYAVTSTGPICSRSPITLRTDAALMSIPGRRDSVREPTG